MSMNLWDILILAAVAGFGCGAWFLLQLIFSDAFREMQLPSDWAAGGTAAGKTLMGEGGRRRERGGARADATSCVPPEGG